MADPIDPKRVKDIKIKTGIVKRFIFVVFRFKAWSLILTERYSDPGKGLASSHKDCY